MVTAKSDDWKLEHCPALTAVRTISGKWKTRILWLLRHRPMQFGELRRRLKDVSAKVLSAQLRQLEADGLVERHGEVVAGVSVAIYGYTDYGRDLIPVLDALSEWGLAHEETARTA